ncbi:tyrosine-type recombinase/integrase [Cellulosimicrobium sp. Marseille-Q4280]|uniref:tyrosine-type recombinase/integrase n=1 Tax=Cellulosimicrobium sp. Marseille-Q4280 TaxID=2937992 RepID=UPI0020417BF6|nr:tyrosine-type recombinase/integrase [Cellulosimicrobium sp. Marseille-Q4280]
MEDVERAGEYWPRGWVKGEGYIDSIIDGRTFASVAEEFFAEQQRRINLGRVKAYSVHRYQRNYALHLEPAFGKLPFADIVPEDISDWIDAELDVPWTPKSIKNWHGLLSSIMKFGQIKLGLRHDNPCQLTELPSTDAREARQIRFFQHGEWALLRSCLKTDVLPLADLLLATGMRWGEVSALRVGDLSVREDDGQESVVIHIVRAWSTRAPDDRTPIRHREGESARWVLGPPKSRRSRYVVVTGDQASRLLSIVEGRGASEYVFVTARGNPWRYTEFHSDRWLPARREAERRGLTKKATPHMLRHTAVVWTLAAGVRIEVVSEMLGHASIQITYDIYGGLIDLHDPVMAQAMATAMTSVRQAIVPAPTRAEVDARPVRPGPRGARRLRTA